MTERSFACRFDRCAGSMCPADEKPAHRPIESVEYPVRTHSFLPRPLFEIGIAASSQPILFILLPAFSSGMSVARPVQCSRRVFAPTCQEDYAPWTMVDDSLGLSCWR